MIKTEVANYQILLSQLKNKIRLARQQATVVVNAQLLYAYWEIGNAVALQEKQEGWGAKTVERLSVDLRAEFEDMKGLSVRNLRYMREFAIAYPDFAILQPPVAKLVKKKTGTSNLQPVAAILKMTEHLNETLKRIPWTHHTIILDRVKSSEERLFYLEKTVENSWSKNVLSLQIENKLYKRQGKSINNFKSTLPEPHSDLAIETIKNPYNLEFISIGAEMKERDLEQALIKNIKQFLLELGKGFAFYGNQKNIQVEGDDFFLDLLFFNTQLNCFVVFELKVGEFKPEYAGKLNFYVNAIDAQLKGNIHQPTIGILLCKTPNETVIKYSLKNIKSPIGVSDFKLADKIPNKLKIGLPSVEELEAEIEKEVIEYKKPIEKKYDRLKQLISELKQPKSKEKRSAKSCEKIFHNVLLPLRNELRKSMALIVNDFIGFEMVIWTDGNGHNKDSDALAFLKTHKEFNQYKIDLRLKGFKPAGTKAFDIWRSVAIKLNNYNYTIGIDNHNPENILIEYLYHDLINKSKITEIAEGVTENIIDDITLQLELINKRKDG